MHTPFIYLTFANDQDDHLHMLKAESSEIFSCLIELDKQQIIRVHRDESIELEEIFEFFSNYKDQVSIFHYGGHSNGSHLKLEDGAGDARGLAVMLGEQEGLKLVFLNGCANKGQVQMLMDAGVKAVIATSVPINDQTAKDFSVKFYEAFSQKRSIGQAFKLAKAFVTARYGDQVDVGFRSIFIEEEEMEADEMPWGLYIKDEHREEILNWKLPYYRPVGLPKDMIQYIGKSFTANRYIVLVLDEMCKYNPAIYTQMVEQRGEETIKKDSRHYPGLIIENFPWPIGSQIRLLRLYDKPNIERLEHLVSTYIVTSQLLYYFLLSDLWDQQRKQELEIKWEHLTMNKETFSAFDFLKHIPDLYGQISEIDLPYVSEFELLITALGHENSPLQKAHTYLEQLREQLRSNPPTSDMDKMCQRVEQAVSIVLRHAAFLARYRMLTVRNISIERHRFERLSYELDMGPLNAAQGIDLNLYQDESFRKKTNFTDSNSVVLVDNEDRLENALNLSPFIIDKNTFVQMKKSETTEKDKLAHIFMLAWEEGERLYYTAVEHSFFTALEKESDQIHTDMSLEDFTEGRNLSEETEDDFGFDFGFEDAGVEDVLEGEDSPRIFGLLKEQYEMLKVDMG